MEYLPAPWVTLPDPDDVLEFVVHWLITGVLTYAVILWLIFLFNVIRKKLLIDAMAQQIADEITRMDIDTPIKIVREMREITAQFAVDGLAKVYAEQRGILINNAAHEAETLAKAGDTVVAFKELKFKNFLFDRTTLRWTIDGLEALIGDHKSIEVAWSRGVRYINRFITTDKKNDLPWVPTYMKLLGLPHNFHASNFEEKVKAAMTRTYPRGFLSLWVASRAFEYRSRLRMFTLRGDAAWKEMIKFKASTLDYERLKSSL